MPLIAIVQASPVHQNLGASLKKALAYIKDAGSKGAKLIVFGECWLCGYPAWIDNGLNVAKWDHPPIKNAFMQMYKNSVSIDSEAIHQLKEAAKINNISIVIGVNEVIEKGPGNGTIFNSLLTINSKGDLANHHRKLMPTFNEKLLYGLGDGAGLNAVETPIGRVGGLICWEHWMPLTRQAMHDQAEDIHVAVWPYVKEMHQIACRQYAFEGRCYVIAVGQIMKVSDVPSGIELPKKMTKHPDNLMLSGGSCIIGPDGQFILEPQHKTDDIIYTTIPGNDNLIREKMALSVSGHYQRPDVFELKIKKERFF